MLPFRLISSGLFGCAAAEQATADEQTGGKYHEQIKKAGAKAEEYVEKLTAEKPDEPEGPAASPGP